VEHYPGEGGTESAKKKKRRVRRGIPNYPHPATGNDILRTTLQDEGAWINRRKPEGHSDWQEELGSKECLKRFTRVENKQRGECFIYRGGRLDAYSAVQERGEKR